MSRSPKLEPHPGATLQRLRAVPSLRAGPLFRNLPSRPPPRRPVGLIATSTGNIRRFVHGHSDRFSPPITCPLPLATALVHSPLLMWRKSSLSALSHSLNRLIVEPFVGEWRY